MYLILRGIFIFSMITIISSGWKKKPLPDKSQGFEIPRYYLDQGWPQLSGYPLSQPSGLGIDTSQNIFVFNRTGRTWTEPFPDLLIPENTILLLDRETGRMLNSWGANLFIMPHGLTVDHQNNVWVTDVSLQEVFKFSHDGKLIMKIGITRETGSDSLRFNRPTDVAVTPDGSFYVSDGYLNSRIVKFSAEGKYLFEWGTKGNKPGQFNIPHAIDLDEKGNVYVADRENARVQVFDANGKFIKEFTDKKMEDLYSVTIDKKTQHLFATDFLVVMKYFTKGSNIMEYDTAGQLLTRFGRATNSIDAPLTRYHDIAADNEGSIYVSDILGNKVHKYKRYIP
jgi:peptidylamidoglycolate lyase